MKATEAVREVMKTKGVRQVDLRKRLGLESNTMSQRLLQENISVTKLNEMLRVMDYKVVIVPSDVRLGQEWFEIE